jgi:hypothetical protein
MRIRNILPAVMLGVGLVGLTVGRAPAVQAEGADAAKIARLIEQLGSDTFAERQKATEALDAIGEPALEALRKAAKSTDAEVRKRAQGLLDKLEKRIENARALAPKMIHLVYKDTPLTGAVADFAKKSGYTIVLYDPDGKLKGQKLTLDTGKVTFWNALEQLCVKAGVFDGDPNARLTPRPLGGGGAPFGGAMPPGAAVPPPLPPPPKAAGKKEEKKAGAPPAPKVPGIAVVGSAPGAPGDMGKWVPVQLSQITLMPGKAASAAVDTSSAVRVRAADKKNYRLSDEEIALVLQISPEPRIRWQYVISIMTDSAIDDNDQKLTQVTPQARGGGRGGAGAAGAPGPGGRIVLLPGGGWANVWSQVSSGGLTHSAAARLKKGEKASKSLKQLTGTILGLVRGDAETILVADDIMKAAGKSFKGKQSGELKILTVEKKDDGSIQIGFEFEVPAGVIAETEIDAPPAPAGAGAAPPAAKLAPPAAAGGFGAPVAPNMPARRFLFNGLTLRDDKGNMLDAKIKINWDKMAGFVAGSRRMEYIATYRPEGKDSPQAAKLVFTGRREITISVPFTLKDIELK